MWEKIIFRRDVFEVKYSSDFIKECVLKYAVTKLYRSFHYVRLFKKNCSNNQVTILPVL